MDMIKGLEGGLASLGVEVNEGDGVAMLDYLVKNLDSDAAQLLRKAVSEERRRDYMAEHMRQKRAALLRKQAETEWTEESYRAAVAEGLKGRHRFGTQIRGHEMDLVLDGLRKARSPLEVADAITAHREKTS